MVAANEGNALALAAGHFLATGKPALVYMQNSGLGNAVNPLLSLADPLVFGLPVLLLIGWRGEPGVKDEAQHLKQGQLTLPLLGCLGLPFEVLPPDDEGIVAALHKAIRHMREKNSPYALVVRKNTFPGAVSLKNEPLPGLTREEAIMEISSAFSLNARFIASTGMIARELYEYRERTGKNHERDFLVIGSMGHASSIALGIALADERPVVCLDGDGAFLMHMGSAAICGAAGPANFRHVVLNNAAHDSVGGLATVADRVDLAAVAQACGYKNVQRALDGLALKRELESFVSLPGPSFLEVKVRKGARPDLGRPGQTPEENLENFRRGMMATDE